MTDLAAIAWLLTGAALSALAACLLWQRSQLQDVTKTDLAHAATLAKLIALQDRQEAQLRAHSRDLDQLVQATGVKRTSVNG